MTSGSCSHVRVHVLAEGIVGIGNVGIVELLIFHILAEHNQRLYLDLLAGGVERRQQMIGLIG